MKSGVSWFINTELTVCLYWQTHLYLHDWLLLSWFKVSVLSGKWGVYLMHFFLQLTGDFNHFMSICQSLNEVKLRSCICGALIWLSKGTQNTLCTHNPHYICPNSFSFLSYSCQRVSLWSGFIRPQDNVGSSGNISSSYEHFLFQCFVAHKEYASIHAL